MAVLYITELVFMIFTLILVLVIADPTAPLTQQYQSTLTQNKISAVVAAIFSLPTLVYTLRGLKIRPPNHLLKPGQNMWKEAAIAYYRKSEQIYREYNQLGLAIVCYACTNAVSLATPSLAQTYLITELRFPQAFTAVVIIIALIVGIIGIAMVRFISNRVSLRLCYSVNAILYAIAIAIAPSCLLPSPCSLVAAANLTTVIQTVGRNAIEMPMVFHVCPNTNVTRLANLTCNGKCSPTMLASAVMTIVPDTKKFQFVSGGTTAPLAIACVFGYSSPPRSCVRHRVPLPPTLTSIFFSQPLPVSFSQSLSISQPLRGLPFSHPHSASSISQPLTVAFLSPLPHNLSLTPCLVYLSPLVHAISLTPCPSPPAHCPCHFPHPLPMAYSLGSPVAARGWGPWLRDSPWSRDSALGVLSPARCAGSWWVGPCASP